MRFAALDFETANNSDASICAAGVAVFEDDEMVLTRQWLVRPPKGHGFFIYTHVHGLTWFDVHESPEFPEVAAKLLPILSSVDCVVAHNADFDLRKLRGTLSHFGLECPDWPYLCTCRLARRFWPGLPHYTLDALCKRIGHHFAHHDAREDAEACGRVLLAMMRDRGVKTPLELLNRPASNKAVVLGRTHERIAAR